MPFSPGRSGNPGGRKSGSRNRKTVHADMAMRELENLPTDLDPAVYLQAVVSHRKAPAALRIQASAILMPFRHSRMTARYLRTPIDLPPPVNVEEAVANIGKISALAAAGQLGLDEANDLAGLQKSYIEAKVGLDIEGQMLELRQIVERLSTSARPVDAVVVGGLSPLPGTNISMPRLSGPPANGGDENGG